MQPLRASEELGVLRAKPCCFPPNHQVIMLSYFNVMKAVDHYAAKGGSAKFIVCDDGFQVPVGAPQEPLDGGCCWV
jgi:hypothetical protein